MHVDVLPVLGQLAALDQPELLHRLQRGEGRGLHDARLLGELALREPVLLPEDAQERPVPERHVVLREPLRERAHQRSRGLTNDACEPLAQSAISRCSRAARSMARHTPIVALAQSPSWSGALPAIRGGYSSPTPSTRGMLGAGSVSTRWSRSP